MMRKLHRWISAAAMIFIAYVAITGTVVAVNELINPASFGQGGGQGPAPEKIVGPQEPLPPKAEVEAMMLRALEIARRAEPNTPLTKAVVALRIKDGVPVAKVTFGTGPKAAVVTIDAQSGEILRRGEDDHGAGFNGLLQQIHSGALYGKVGMVLVILTGLCMTFLSISGIVMYFDLLGRRRKLDKRQLFWR